MQFEPSKAIVVLYLYLAYNEITKLRLHFSSFHLKRQMGPRYKCWHGYTVKEKPIELFVSLVQGAENRQRTKMEKKKKETLGSRY